MNIIIDTDVGYDDLLAILFLMNCPGITIQAFTVVNGISTVTEGSNTLLSLQEMMGMGTATNPAAIPVYLGADDSQQANSLPPEYTGEAAKLGWAPPARLTAETQSASSYLTAQFNTPDPTTVLAIGPLTNLAAALPSPSTANVTVYAMGGAFKVAGDLPSGYPSDVEANFYVDPAGAATVMSNASSIVLVPLDACDRVRIRPHYIDKFLALPSDQQKPNWKYAEQIWEQPEINRWAKKKEYYAWDELAAMVLYFKNVFNIPQVGVAVEQGNPSPGKTTTTTTGTQNVRIIYTYSGTAFRYRFLAAFET